MIERSRQPPTQNLEQLQNLPLQAKETLALKRIKEFFEMNDGNVYVSFSGGKDSTVLLHLVRRFYPDVEGMIVNTGMEHPENIKFSKTVDNLKWMRPKKTFSQVCKENGFPVVSKNVSRYVSDLQNPTPNNKRTRQVRLGLTGGKVGVLSKKWRYLVNADFKCSDRCCDVMKKEPAHRYERETGNAGIIGTMADESMMRKLTWMKQGCFNHTKNLVMPLSVWTDKDVWDYIKKYDLKYSKAYDMGEKRTGCMMCPYGAHLEQEPNRYQRMEIYYPKILKYHLEVTGMKKVLDTIGVPYTNKQKNLSEFK